MKIVAISDIHGNAASIDRLSPVLESADLVLVSGDITNFGGRREAAEVFDRLAGHARRILAVPGNCDRGEVGAYLNEKGMNLEHTAVEIEGMFLSGLGGALSGPVPTPYEHNDAEIGKALADSVSGLPRGAPLVILSHQPPFGTKADQVRGGRNVGSRALREFLEEHQPLACFCGHIHESPGLDSIGETKVANPGPLPQGGYAWAEWEGGGLKVELKSVK